MGLPTRAVRRIKDGGRHGAASTVNILLVIMVLASVIAAAFLYNQVVAMDNACPMPSGMSMEMSTGGSMTQIVQNATTADYKITLVIGPPQNMMTLCQDTASASGMVMVQGTMMAMASSTMSGTSDYHFQAHVYDISTGAPVLPPTSSVTIIVTGSSGLATSIPVAEMFDATQGPQSMHYGNEVQLTPGKYAVTVGVAGETAEFNVTLS